MSDQESLVIGGISFHIIEDENAPPDTITIVAGDWRGYVELRCLNCGQTFWGDQKHVCDAEST